MATINLADARNKAQRSTVEPSPVWLSSGLIDHSMAGKGALCFMFETRWGGVAVIHGAVLEVLEAFAGGTPSIDVGEGSVLYGHDAFESNSVITIVDADEFIPSADITEGTIGKYPALTGDCVTLWAAGQSKLITCNDTTIPVIYATLSSSLTAGIARLHILASLLPVA